LEELTKLCSPCVVNLRDHLDFAALGVANQTRAYALLGGIYPSGSIKDVGLLGALHKAWRSGRYRKGQPLAEISNGSMARSVSWLSGGLGVECFIAFPGSTKDQVGAICGGNRVRHLDIQSSHLDEGHPLVRYFDGFEKRCQQCELFYPHQTRNPDFRAAYRDLGALVLDELRQRYAVVKVDQIIGSIGTGSTLLGLSEGVALPGASRPEVTGVEPALRSNPSSMPWEDIPGLRNTRAFHWSEFGRNDAYDAALVDRRVEVTRSDAARQADTLARGGLRGGLSAGATLVGFFEAAKYQKEGTFLLVLSDTNVS
jgi:cysteine synthase